MPGVRGAGVREEFDFEEFEEFQEFEEFDFRGVRRSWNPEEFVFGGVRGVRFLQEFVGVGLGVQQEFVGVRYQLKAQLKAKEVVLL